MVVLAALFVASCAQVSFALPQSWSNYVGLAYQVPITLQTFGVFVIGPTLGHKLSTLALILYYSLVLVGAPFAAFQAGGLQVIDGGSGGYFIGFILAAFMTGKLTSLKGYDRQYKWCLLAMCLGNLVIYICGLTWMPFGMALSNNVPVSSVSCGFEYGCIGNILMWGLVPFIPGDILKIFLAWVLLPVGWKYIGKLSTRNTLYFPVEEGSDLS